MIRKIIKDEKFLSQKSEPAAAADMQVANDLVDTINDNRDRCVGMAANMIGVHKNIIVFDYFSVPMVMFNPVIIKRSGPYEAEEGCLSLDGTRKTIRYQEITVRFQNMAFKQMESSFTGYTAQIIQHEIDHLAGVLI